MGPGTRRWVEKTPYNERYAPRIFEWWPQARCLHVVRDPRDNFASYRIKHADWTPGVFADRGWRSIAEGWNNERRFGPGRHRIIRYEDLVLKTDEAIAEIVAFLEIDDIGLLRSPTRDGRTWAGNSMFGESFEGISRSPVGRHAESLSPQDRLGIEKRLEPEMARLGYQLVEPLTAAERISGRLARAKWAWRSLRTPRR
jgi:hypothetical protein